MRSTPAAMPPAKSPSRKRGVMVSSMIRLATRSVSAPSSPRPTSMRSARSCIATSSSAPSSGFSRPSFQASTTRIEYCSIASGCVVGTISTAICAPFLASKAASFASRPERSAGVSVPTRSVTRDSSGGTACSDCATAAAGTAAARSHAAATAASASRNLKRGRSLYRPAVIHRTHAEPAKGAALFRSAGASAGCAGGVSKSTAGGREIVGLVLDGEIRLHVVAEHLRGQVDRELPDRRVEGLHGLDVAVARHGDAILGALELRLQVAEVLVGFQVRIPLDDHEQAFQRAGQLALGCLEFLQRFGIVDQSPASPGWRSRGRALR